MTWIDFKSARGDWNVKVWLLMLSLASTDCGLHRLAAGAPSSTPRSKTAVQQTLAPTLESTDPKLRAALLALAAVPGAASHRQVAIEYRRLGVIDAAHEHFTAAVRLQQSDAFSHDALARIWRDWGMPNRGLDEARRAVSYAPKSAAAANTLGTIFQALGEFSEAKRWYNRAAALDPKAWYAMNNLCYAEIMSREPYAVLTCRRAVDAAPDAQAPRNNLALAHAAAGHFDEARLWFRRAADTATADYNYGIVMMSTRAYREAEAAFQSALLADPQFTLAATRARQARIAALAEEQINAGD
jgi:tetratricopeptide (TPR) repeat protein